MLPAISVDSVHSSDRLLQIPLAGSPRPIQNSGLTEPHQWVIPRSHYITLALIFKSSASLMSPLTRAPYQRQIGGWFRACKSMLERYVWTGQRDKTKRQEARWCLIPDIGQAKYLEWVSDSSRATGNQSIRNAVRGNLGEGSYQWTGNFIVRQCFSMIWRPCSPHGLRPWKKAWRSCGGNITRLTSVFFQEEMSFGDQSDSLGIPLGQKSCSLWPHCGCTFT